MTGNSTQNPQWRLDRWVLIVLFLIAVCNPPASVGQTSPVIEQAQWQVLIQELRNLRIELVQAKIERATERIAVLQQELQKAEADRAAADDLERSHTEEIAESLGQLLQPGLSPQERSEIEKHRQQMLTIGTSRVEELKKAAAIRESELRQRLNAYQQYERQLLETLGALKGASDRKP